MLPFLLKLIFFTYNLFPHRYIQAPGNFWACSSNAHENEKAENWEGEDEGIDT